MPTITGKVLVNGTPKQRSVKAYLRSTGELVGYTFSDALTGEYTITTPTTATHFVVVLENDGEETRYQSKIRDFVVPV